MPLVLLVLNACVPRPQCIASLTMEVLSEGCDPPHLNASSTSRNDECTYVTLYIFLEHNLGLCSEHFILPFECRAFLSLEGRLFLTLTTLLSFIKAFFF